MKKIGFKFLAFLISTMMFICSIQVIHAEENVYSHSDSATSGDVTLKVEWNDPVLGQPNTFHVSATGGSGIYKFNMEAPSYTNPDVTAYESVADPSRGEWTKYSDECTSQDYTFTMMASGTYNFRFHVMDIKAGVTYLRTNTYIQVSSSDYPSVNSIVQSAVAQCNNATDGSDYQKALWLHDWLLNQLEYDNSLKWSSAESALTRGLGTCQAYERAYAQLLSAAGIENAETRDTYDGHTWNAMKLDGEWYQVDCTWNDSKDNWYNFDQRRLYFGLTDELMAIAHPGYSNIYTTEGYNVRSTSLKNNYFVKNGEAQQWADSYKDRIQNSLNSKQTQFSIQADNSTYPPSIYKIQNGIIAYVMNQNEWFVDGKKVSLVATVNDKQFDFNVTYLIECTKHDWNEFEVTTEPTCTKDGIKTYTCKNCSTTKTETIKALGHDYSNEWTIDKESTCQEEGSKSHHCSRCDDKEDITTISKKDHEWDNGTITKEPTNKETGIKTYKCHNCDDVKNEEIPVIKEDFSVDSEAPVIDMSTLKLSSNRVVVGDKVQIAVKVTDNVEVSKVLISFRNSETSKLNNIELKFNEKSDLYEGVFSVTEDISSGSWYIYDIEAYDAVGNQNLKLLDENDYSIIVDNPNLDSEAPVIYKDTVKFNQSTATTGDSVILSVKITDNIGIKNAKFTMYNEETNKEEFLTLEYNKKSGLYEGLFKIKSNMPSGHWFLFDIEVYDTTDNYGLESFFIGDKHWVIVTRNNKDVHKWNEGIVTTEPLCTKEGIKTFECSICNKTKTEAIKSLGHDYSSEWTIDKAATCTQEGSKSHHCTRCDDKKDVTTISKTNHNWDSGVETIKATCTKDGVKTYTCKDCKTTKTEVIKAVGHDYSNEWTIDKPATCTQEGSKSHHCTRCDDKKDITTIPKTDHNWNLGVDTIKATCTQSGVKTYTCKDCKTTKTEVIKALGHDYSSEWTIDKEATCTEEGSKSHHCTRCDDKKDVTTISKTNHNWDSGVETTKATCTKDGVKVYTCKNCATTKAETIKALGHDYSNEWTIDNPATCTEEGSKSHHCTRCEDKKDVTRIETLNHSWKLTSTIKSTKDKEGKNIYTCSLCNEKREEVIPKLIGKWVTNNSGKWYRYPDGTYENTGFKKINESTYYFQSNGYVKTGWLLDNNVWYYFNKDGIMQTGWSGPGRQYYFDDVGKMLEKQFTPDGYYVGSSGAYVRNGWVLNNGKYYYMNGSGKMVKCSWVGSYYLGSDGVMVTNKWVQWNGKYYYLDSQGVYVKNKWIGSYYLSSNGVMATNSWVGNYWCGSDGQYVKSSWVDNNRYYVNNKGLYVVGSWQKDSVGWYYRVGNDYAKNITLNINGLAYKFDSRGYWAS